jgi:acyl-CoA synthetase (AMP-forming)/AMP-acid ligase II
MNVARSEASAEGRALFGSTGMRQFVIMLAAVWMTGACGLLLENPAPERARLVIVGDAGKSVRLITSTEFVAAVNEQGQTRVEMFVSDTLVTTLPYERVFDIEDDQRFLVEAAWIDADFDAVSVQVFLDDAVRFDEAGVLKDGQPYRFVYMFNQAFTRDILLL